MLTLNMKGDFDAVIGQLDCLVQEQGWLESLVNLVASFATNCSVQICLDGKLGPL